MAFDMGFDFRDTAGYVTDPTYGVPVLKEAYPHTYTNGDGKSINAGWTGVRTSVDASTTVDVRLAGLNNVYTDTNGGIGDFTIDLSSGSAPGAGTYTVDCAIGSSVYACDADLITIKDNTTVIQTIISSFTTWAVGTYKDVTGTSRQPGTGSWDLVRATVSLVFASVTANLHIENTSAAGNATQLAHFRLTLAAADTLMGQGAM